MLHRPRNLRSKYTSWLKCAKLSDPIFSKSRHIKGTCTHILIVCEQQLAYTVPGRCIREYTGHHHRFNLVDTVPEDGDFKDYEVRIEELEYADVSHLKSIVPCEIEPPCGDFALEAIGGRLGINTELDWPCSAANSQCPLYMAVF